ncbi:fimbrial protein [Burkholderia ambifaria]|uniref:fimbrial protein n=1 Tax=Burkholderia ambifaria TaxID=152480 RepID=UPI0015894835|nr:fimbrial protein [Burkholderia ambifaria]
MDRAKMQYVRNTPRRCSKAAPNVVSVTCLQVLRKVFIGLAKARRIITLAMIALYALWAPSSYAIDQTVTAFGSSVTLPESLPVGTIVSRDYISMQQMCGAATCYVNAVSLWPYGGGQVATGPDIETNVSGISVRLLINGVPQARKDAFTGSGVTIRQPLELQLVRDGRPLAPGSLAGGQGNSNPSYFYLCDRQIEGFYCGSVSTKLAIVLSGTIRFVKGTCQIPDQTVVLPGISSARFGGIGTTAGFPGSMPFELKFNNCPAGFARVGYSIKPVGAPVQAVSGTLPLGQGSTGSGIGIQLVDRTNVPVSFNTSITLTAYKTATGGSYSVPLVAQYVQTGANIKAGSVRGAAEILVDYR